MSTTFGTYSVARSSALLSHENWITRISMLEDTDNETIIIYRRRINKQSSKRILDRAMKLLDWIRANYASNYVNSLSDKLFK